MNSHGQMFKSKSIAIDCPQLVEGQNVYTEGMGGWGNQEKINALDMLLKQSFCGGGMLQTTRDVFAKLKSKVSFMAVMISHMFSDGIQACFVVDSDTSKIGK